MSRDVPSTLNYFGDGGFIDPSLEPPSGGGGGGSGKKSPFEAIGDAISSVGKGVESAVNSVGKTLEAIIQNPLPTIETIILVANGVPPAVASATVTAINGGDISQIATAAAAGYIGQQVYASVQSSLTPLNEVGAYSTANIVGDIPSEALGTSATDKLLIKAASSAVGADAAATTKALASGKNFEDALAAGTQAAVTSLAGSAGAAAGSEVASNIDDPTLAKIAGSATKGATTAALTGKDIGSAASKSAQGDILDAAGNVISQYAPDLSGSSNIDLTGIKEAIQPISDAATKVLQPLEAPITSVIRSGSDAATSLLQPLEQPIKDVAQAGSDAATKLLQPLEEPIKSIIRSGSDAATRVLQPLEKPIKDAAKKAGDAFTVVSKPVSNASSIAEDVKDSPADNLDKSIINLMEQAPTSDTLGKSAVSNVASGSESSSSEGGSSPAAFGGADVAMLGDTSESGLGSKVSKKGGKYPWGEPEGTTALKEGLGI